MANAIEGRLVRRRASLLSMPNTLSSSPQRASVLLVDDFRDAGRTSDVLTADGNSRVTVARDFTSALKSLATHAPDVLITETRLGEYNGLHLVLRLREINPAAVAIVLTELPDSVLAREAEGLGAACLLKPVDATALLDVMNDGLRKQTAPGQNATPEGVADGGPSASRM